VVLIAIIGAVAASLTVWAATEPDSIAACAVLVKHKAKVSDVNLLLIYTIPLH